MIKTFGFSKLVFSRRSIVVLLSTFAVGVQHAHSSTSPRDFLSDSSGDEHRGNSHS
jgi:hypothetical protein